MSKHLDRAGSQRADETPITTDPFGVTCLFPDWDASTSRIRARSAWHRCGGVPVCQHACDKVLSRGRMPVSRRISVSEAIKHRPLSAIEIEILRLRLAAFA